MSHVAETDPVVKGLQAPLHVVPGSEVAPQEKAPFGGFGGLPTHTAVRTRAGVMLPGEASETESGGESERGKQRDRQPGT